jgi:hypothetical protein
MTISVSLSLRESEHSKSAATEAIPKHNQWQISVLSTDFENAIKMGESYLN